MNPDKYTSRKFIVMVAVAIGAGVLLWFGKITADHFVDLLKWDFTTYFMANNVEAYIQTTAKKE
jgi:hypothetical protein